MHYSSYYNLIVKNRTTNQLSLQWWILVIQGKKHAVTTKLFKIQLSGVSRKTLNTSKGALQDAWKIRSSGAVISFICISVGAFIENEFWTKYPRVWCQGFRWKPFKIASSKSGKPETSLNKLRCSPQRQKNIPSPDATTTKTACRIISLRVCFWRGIPTVICMPLEKIAYTRLWTLACL